MQPADYTLVCEYASYTCEDDWGNKYTETEGYSVAQIAYAEQPVAVHSADIDRCDLCGADHGTGAVYQHVPSGDMLSIGWRCAEKVELAANFNHVSKVKADLRQRALLRADKRRKTAQLFVWARANREVLPLLRTDHNIVRDIRAKLISSGVAWGGLTDKQVALLRKLADAASELHVPVPHPMGERVEITGTIVSIKTTTGYYGDQTRMTVKVDTPDGSWMVNGTAPDALFDLGAKRVDDTREERHQARMAEWRELQRQREAGEITARQFEDAEVEWDVRGREADSEPVTKGATVTFRAVLQPSDNAHFAFFKRPTKLRVDSWPALQV